MKTTTISLLGIVRRCWQHKLLIVINTIVVFILSALFIVQIPRYYKAQVRMAPEEEAGGSISSLATIASNFGVDLATGNSTDAISPQLYPDLFDSNDFIVSLMSIAVETADGKVKTDYYTYLMEHQKYAPWDPMVNKIKSLFKEKEEPIAAGAGSQFINDEHPHGLNPFRLTRRQTELVKTVKSNIVCSIDNKTDVLCIQVTDQDALVAATMADSVRVRLQQFITNYRTNKAHVDEAYYEQLVKESYDAYVKAQRKYAAYADTHQEAALAVVSTEESDLENEMEGAYSTYNALRTQLQSAKAKVQERTPAFTVLEVASVPVKPAGPKRMIFVAFMCCLAIFFSIVWLFRKEIFAKMSAGEVQEEDEEVEDDLAADED